MQLVSGQGTTTATYQLESNFNGGEIAVSYGGGNCTNLKTIAKCSGSCGYYVGIPNGYIDGPQSGANEIYLTASTSFPSGTVFEWKIYRQNGTINFYTANSDNPRLIQASNSNRIIKAKVTATFLNCSDSYTKTYVNPIPDSDGGGLN